MRSKWLLLTLLCWPGLAQAGNPRTQPPTTDTALANYLRSLENHLNTLEVLGADPNGAVLGGKGDLKGALFDSTNHVCMNTSTGPQKGTAWTCLGGSSAGTPGGSNTMVQFNDASTFGGDAGFLYGKTVDHASLGPDAAIDKTFSPDNWTYYSGGSSGSNLFTMSDARGDWGTTNLNGLEVEFLSTPSGTQGFDNVIFNGITGRFVVNGNAGTGVNDRWLVDSMFSSNVFNALIDIEGTGTVDSINSMIGAGINHEFRVNLAGAGATNDINGITWQSVSDNNRIISDIVGNITFLSHNHNLRIDATTNDGVISLPSFSANIDLNISGTAETTTTVGYDSTYDLTAGNMGTHVTEHFLANGSYAASANTNDDLISDFGLDYNFTASGATTADQVYSAAVDSSQFVDLEILDDGASATPQQELYGVLSNQEIGSNNDSGTFNIMRGMDLTQVWSGDANGNSVDGIKITGLTKAGSGTVTTVTDLNLIAPVKSAGTMTNAYTIQLTTPTTGGTENAGMRFVDGLSNLIEFEGNTADGFETRFSLVEPTADNTITIPDTGGTMAVSSAISAGQATCWKADGKTLGYCSSVVGVGGACTCN